MLTNLSSLIPRSLHCVYVCVQERWQLRQEGLRLKTQQTAFEEEKMASLRRVEEEKDHLQQTKVNSSLMEGNN